MNNDKKEENYMFVEIGLGMSLGVSWGMAIGSAIKKDDKDNKK